MYVMRVQFVLIKCLLQETRRRARWVLCGLRWRHRRVDRKSQVSAWGSWMGSRLSFQARKQMLLILFVYRRYFVSADVMMRCWDMCHQDLIFDILLPVWALLYIHLFCRRLMLWYWICSTPQRGQCVYVWSARCGKGLGTVTMQWLAGWARIV
jgi:hypothetical protein